MNEFFPGHYSRQVAAVAGDASRAVSKAGRLALEVSELTRRVDRLALACQALWELAQPQLALTDEMLQEKMQEIDVRDGEADGGIARTVVKCPACGKPSNSRRHQCIYCGARITPPNTFG